MHSVLRPLVAELENVFGIGECPVRVGAVSGDDAVCVKKLSLRKSRKAQINGHELSVPKGVWVLVREEGCEEEEEDEEVAICCWMMTSGGSPKPSRSVVR